MARKYQKHGDRREVIVRATLVLIGERGPDAVTHRAVAARAGVPLAATTYYFDSKEQLLDEALTLVAREDVERIERVVSDLAALEAAPEQWAEALSRTVAEDLLRARADHLAIYELLLEAARRPSLRPDVERWREAFLRLAEVGLRSVGSRDPETEATVVFAVVTGLMLGQLAAPRDDFEQAVLRPALDHLLRRLVGVAEPAPAG